jgi:hypothetical protein
VIAPARRWIAAAAALAAGAAAALALPEGGGRATLEDMDMGLLQRNLLKLYVCEKEAGINAKSLAAFRRSMKEKADPTVPSLTQPKPEDLELLRQREKDISHYLLLEKTDAVQMIHIVDRILGTDVHLAGEGREERAILEKRVEIIDIPRNTEVREAGRLISEALGVPVRVEVVDTEINKLGMTMGPTTGEAIIKQFCSSAPFRYRIEGGTIVFRHTDLPASGEAPKKTPGVGSGEANDEGD